MASSRRGLVAPQNTFLEHIIRHFNGNNSSFLLASARIMDFPILHCNDGFCALTRYTRAEVMQKSSLCPFMHRENTSSEIVANLAHSMEEGRETEVELLLQKKNKSPMWVIIHAAPVVNEANDIIFYLLTFRDVTAFREPLVEEDNEKAGATKFSRLAKSVAKTRPTTMLSSMNVDEYGAEDLDSGRVGNLANILPKYRQETPKPPPHIILHYAAVKSIWDWVILIMTGYTAVMVPFNVAFGNKTGDDLITTIINSLVDSIFFLDIILNFHTTFVGPNGEVIAAARTIRSNYCRGWFMIDLISCLPYDVFNAFQPEANQGVSSLFSALKVLRLLRLGRVVRKMDQYVEYSVILLFMMVFGFLLMAHWLACIWYSVGYSDLSSGIYYGWIPKMMNDTNQYPDIALNSTNWADSLPENYFSYFTALYYTLSVVTTIGFGNVCGTTLREKICTAAFMLIGSLMYATIFGNVTTLVQQMNSARARYQEMINSVKEFLKIHDVPPELGERVLDYVTASWTVTKGIDTARVLNYCPKDMRADLCVHLNRLVFNEHPAFRLASDGCLRSLAVNFVTLHTAPGDLIFHQGESVDQLCFVVSGSLEVVQDDEIVGIIGKGDVFGDSVWKDSTTGLSTATVRTLTYCELHCIKREKLLEVLHFYHTFANSFSRNLVLTINLRNRLIFRKISDVQREKRLAESRTAETGISELSADHPVRKLISRFRKMSDRKDQLPPDTVALQLQTTSFNGAENPDQEGNPPNTEDSNLSNNQATTPIEEKQFSLKKTLFSGSEKSDSQQKASTPTGPNALIVPKTEPDPPRRKFWPGNRFSSSPTTPSSGTSLQSSPSSTSSTDAGRSKSAKPMKDFLQIAPIKEETDEGDSNENSRKTSLKVVPSDTPVSTMFMRGADSKDEANWNALKKHVSNSIMELRSDMRDEMDTLRERMDSLNEHMQKILLMLAREPTAPNSQGGLPLLGHSNFGTPHKFPTQPLNLLSSTDSNFYNGTNTDREVPPPNRPSSAGSSSASKESQLSKDSNTSIHSTIQISMQDKPASATTITQENSHSRSSIPPRSSASNKDAGQKTNQTGKFLKKPAK